MKKLFAAVLGASVTLSAGLAAMAADYPTQTFDATYNSKNPAGSGTVHMISDGKGHMRTESSLGGQNTVTIMDYPNKSMTTLLVNQKLAMKMPLGTAPQQSNNEEAMKKVGAKSLGAKTVNGHPCHGWEYSEKGIKTQVWTGDDIHYMVKSESTTPQGTMSMDLTKWSGSAPAASSFAVPSDYKTQAIPGAH